MAEDWRATLVVEGGPGGESLAGALRGWSPERELEHELPGRVVVSHDGPRLFLYATSRADLERAVDTARRALGAHGAAASVRIERWHDLEERWEDAARPLPATPEEQQAEREALAARERAESRARHAPDWDVRVDMPDRRAAIELEERLRAEGLAPIRRWRYVVVGVESEEDGDRLAERIRSEAPAGASAWVEGSVEAAERALPYGNVFAIFGGLGR